MWWSCRKRDAEEVWLYLKRPTVAGKELVRCFC